VSGNFEDSAVVPHSVYEETTENSIIHSRPHPSSKQWALSALLFVVTLISTSFAGLFFIIGTLDFFKNIRIVIYRPDLILYGLQFSIPLIAILLAHELGHFLACRFYGLHCTPPYFIPVPISISGTLGAFIKIKSPFENKKQLFDIGIAGPLAGFVLTLPVLWIGISLSRIIPKGLSSSGAISFGEPIIFHLIGALALGYDPSMHDMLPHPVAMAGWIGLLVTSLNLFPIWQLDGGHIAYAVFSLKVQKYLSIAVLALLVLIGLSGWPTPSYMVFGVLVFILGYRQRFFHPASLREWEPIGKKRIVLAILAFIILILCFTPVPVSFN
jgi:membrane-associated protease RseP (regulator of RpoE activity)